MSSSKRSPPTCRQWAEGVAFDPAGKKLAVGGKGHLRIWDVDKKEVVFADDTVVDVIYSFTWSADGATLYASGSAAVQAIDVAGRKRRAPENTESGNLVLTPDGKWVIARQKASSILKVLDATTGRTDRRRRRSVHGQRLLRLALRRDSSNIAPTSTKKPSTSSTTFPAQTTDRHAAAAGEATRLRSGGTQARRRHADRDDLRVSADGRPLAVFPNNNGVVNDVSISPDGNRLSAVGRHITVREFGGSARLDSGTTALPDAAFSCGGVESGRRDVGRRRRRRCARDRLL